ncbi:NUDIX domain-containing protein [Exiguobacterium aestuarii]|uniref:NUDIX domain-containing protein n=1 Tax=Exiguobacterium aestuarii TaxID=273527 RepID=A0ABW2PJ75_9BACL|nr:MULTISPECIES: NUDIX domain-containing protein [Exiguobacterium]MCT4786219.1 NUDIX domain-containing protein [Exiguobacterium aestuarii]
MSREAWDLFDAHRQPLGRTHFRGDELEPNTFHTVIEVFTFDKDGKLLLSQRHSDKTYPLLWEGTGGSILAGESSRQGAVRELKEELGLHVDPAQLRFVTTVKRGTYFLDLYVYGCEQPIDVEQLSLQADEVVDVRFVDWDTVLDSIELVPTVKERLIRFGHLIRT